MVSFTKFERSIVSYGHRKHIYTRRKGNVGGGAGSGGERERREGERFAEPAIRFYKMCSTDISVCRRPKALSAQASIYINFFQTRFLLFNYDALHGKTCSENWSCIAK